MSNQARRNSRKGREEYKQQQAKFVPDSNGDIETEHYVQQALPRLQAKNDNQRLAFKYLDEGRELVFLRGASGSGKSLIATYHAAKLLKQKKIDKVYLIRPAVLCGNTIGLLKGDLKEKCSAFFMQTIAHLETHMGKAFTKYCLDKEIVQYIPFEYIRGMSLENAVCIVEECQNLTHAEFETLLSRKGVGCTLILTGDERQRDLKQESGLTTTIRMLENVIDTAPEYMSDEDLDMLENNIGVVTFGVDDNQRGGVTKAVCKMYYFE